jgi:uncharacterized protein (TIGR00369 family)
MDADERKTWLDQLTQVAEGEFAGWWTFAGLDPFEDLSGPFYLRQDRGKPPQMAFRAQKRHMNGAGFMHGGCLMTFSDFALFVIAHRELRHGMAVTATFNCEFIGSVSEGALVEASGEVVKAGRSMIFVRGLVTSAAEPVLNFSAVLKRISARG